MQKKNVFFFYKYEKLISVLSVLSASYVYYKIYLVKKYVSE